MDTLPGNLQARVAAKIEFLRENPFALTFPHMSSLGGGFRELRIQLGGQAQRISYYLASNRRILLLTVFRKTKQREKAQVERARSAMREHRSR